MNNHSTEKREEALLAISLWRESGVSQGAFCRRENIARSTFQHWRKRYDSTYEYQEKRKPEDSNPPKESFIAVEMSGSASYGSNELEIIYQNGVRIKCDTDLPFPQLQQLLRLQVD